MLWRVDGAARFRRRLVSPFTRAGAAVLACDHLPMVHDASRRDAYGSVHKGNALDGARILLENTAPFGRGMHDSRNPTAPSGRRPHAGGPVGCIRSCGVGWHHGSQISLPISRRPVCCLPRVAGWCHNVSKPAAYAGASGGW